MPFWWKPGEVWECCPSLCTRSSPAQPRALRWRRASLLIDDCVDGRERENMHDIMLMWRCANMYGCQWPWKLNRGMANLCVNICSRICMINGPPMGGTWTSCYSASIVGKHVRAMHVWTFTFNWIRVDGRGNISNNNCLGKPTVCINNLVAIVLEGGAGLALWTPHAPRAT